MLLLHDAHVLSPCFTLGLFVSQRRQTAENSQETMNCEELGMWVLISYSKQTLSLGTKAAMQAQNRATPFPLCQVSSHLQLNGMENIWSWTRQDKTCNPFLPFKSPSLLSFIRKQNMKRRM